MEIKGRIKTIQTTTLLKSVRMVRRVLEIWRDLLSLTPMKDYQLTLCENLKGIWQKWKRIGILIQSVRIYSDDIRIAFGIKEMWHANNEKGKTINDGRNRTTKSRKNQNTWRKGNLQILGNIERGHHQICGNERKNLKKEYHSKTRKLLKIKPHSRNIIKEINTWVVPLVRYSGPFLKWTREELQQIEQRIGKAITMHKALHPRDGVDRLHVSRKEGGRIASI